MEDADGSSGTEPQPVASEPPPSTIDTAAKLIDALNHAAPGDTITLRSQEYRVGVPLIVRDRVTLQGAGEMLPNQGLPTGFKQGSKTTIIGNRDLAGNLLTLGNQSSLRRLVLQGPNEFQVDAAGRPIGGNVVAVASRRQDGSVSAMIEERELINNLESGGGADGPTGGAILAYTRNPEGATTPPHVNAMVTVEVTRSIVRTHEDGKAVFAMNFASSGEVTINLTKNDIRGPLDVIGGYRDRTQSATRKPPSSRRKIITRREQQAMSKRGTSSVEVAGRSAGPRIRTRTLPVSSRQTTRLRTSRLGSWRSVAANSAPTTAPARTTPLISQSPE